MAVEAFDDVEDIFLREGFEEEQVGGVVVGGDGFGVGVDHDGFKAEFFGGEGGLDAAVVEFDALADAVGAAAEDDDFFLLGDADFIGSADGRDAIFRLLRPFRLSLLLCCFQQG